MKKKYFTLYDPIFLLRLHICIGGTYQDAVNFYAKREKIKPWKVEDTERTANFTWQEGCKDGVIWLSVPLAEYLAHEAFHAAYYVHDIGGVKLDKGNQEMYAYYIQWIMREVHKRVRLR